MKTRSNVKQSLKFFWLFTRPSKGYFWYGTIGAGIGTLLQEVLPPVIVATAFNQLQGTVNSGEGIILSSYVQYIWWYLGLMTAGMIMFRTQASAVWIYEIRAQRDMAIYIFDHLQRLGRRFHADRFGGALVSATNKFIGGYEKVMDEFTWSITTGVVAFISSLIVLSIMAPHYALLFLIIASIYFGIMYVRIKNTYKFERAVATSESDRTAKIADMITNVSAVSSFAGEKHEKKLFTKQADETARHYFRLFRRTMTNEIMSHGMTGLISTTAFASGILAITVFNQPAGALYLVVIYTLSLTQRLWQSTKMMRNLNRSFGDANDMTEILQLVPEIMDVEAAKKLRLTRGDIRFEKVNFAYDDQKDGYLFSNLNLHIKPGEKIGLVGRSGGGKTTITQLILRFMDIDGGEIKIDGQDIAQVTQESLRSNIAYVPQEPILFHRSLADNIAYGRKDASVEEIKYFAKLAHADEFIDNLSEGYDTLVGERGVKLSGGQRQRIAIARAMLKNAPILLLDEATSALDSESEVLIQDALWKLMENRTAIVIAHRLSTIQKMDRIIVMNNGQVSEEGTHKELIRKGGTYAELWSHQSGGFLDGNNSNLEEEPRKDR